MTAHTEYDLAVLGGGAAAFAAVTEADRRGLSAALVNTGLPLGGTCVNVGCVPSKRLLAVGKTAAEPAATPFDAVSHETPPTVDWDAARAGKDQLVADFRRRNYVDVAERFDVAVYEGYGRLSEIGAESETDGDSVGIGVVSGPDAGATVAGRTVLVATGSSPRVPAVDGIEAVDYETSESVLDRETLPDSVVMLGGGYVGMEWSQILSRLGVRVTVLQRSGTVLSGMEPQLGCELRRCLEAEGVSILTDAGVRRVAGAEDEAGGDEAGGGDASDGVVVTATVDGETRTVAAETLFVATGVTPNTDDVGLGAADVATDDAGAVAVDERFQTTNPDVYAAGDCVGEPMLETVAAKEGHHAVKNAFDAAPVNGGRESGGESGPATVDYDAVPEVVFTSPEVAAVGVTEREYMAEHGTCSCRTVEMEDVPRAQAVEDTRGLVQVVKHHETDELVGVHMVGPRAADMISEATLAVKFGLTVDDVIDTIHPFPTFSEAFKHACQAFYRDPSAMSCCVE
ncbi:MAG: mercury(II) reductase [Halolamina sp.]